MPTTFKELRARIDESILKESFIDKNIDRQNSVLLREIVRKFQDTYKPKPETEVFTYFVPGRLEVLGKHTDYAGGHSLLFSLDRGFYCVCKANKTSMVQFKDVNPSFGERTFNIKECSKGTLNDWVNYPITVVKRLCKNFDNNKKGVDLVFGSDLPPAGGMSSSSALIIMFFLVMSAVNEIYKHSLYGENLTNQLDLATYLACVENGQTFQGLAGEQGVGTIGGSEDHTIIMNGKRGMISLYQFAPIVHKADIPLPDDLAYIVLYSGLKSEKTGETKYMYNLAAKKANLVVELYNHAFGKSHKLMRDILAENQSIETNKMLTKVTQATSHYSELGQDLDLPNRFYQFYLENKIFIPNATKALATRDYTSLANVINLSHNASKNYLCNIAPEIDFLQKEATRLGALAASGFGAGLGGSAYALLRADDVEDFSERIEKSYKRKFPNYSKVASFFQAHPSIGACELFSQIKD